MKILSFFKAIILIIWQIPQIIFSLIILWIYFGKIVNVIHYKKAHAVIVDNLEFLGGICFGKIMFINSKVKPERIDYIITHEYGHSIQSMIVGPLYLFIIGIPSITKLIIYNMRLKENPESKEKLQKWYNSGFPENWAEKLIGGVLS